MLSRPRIGFLGTGWIGRHRMEAMLATGAIEAVAVADGADEAAAAACALAPSARRCASLDEMLALGLDGVVIATPSALHAGQAIAALEAGCAVFCQKPLGRDAGEARRVIAAARAADRLLSVDFSYRLTAGMVAIRDLLAAGALGPIHAVDLVFHNAYGPDKPWFYDRSQAGGGCVMDLGVHLVDLALWALDFPAVEAVEADLFSGGAPIASDAVEDLALATLRLAGGTVVRLACSWRLHAGRDAVIAAEFQGRHGGAALRNVDGSFYDFTAEHFTGTRADRLAGPPDAWGGRAAAAWAERIAASPRYDADAEHLVQVSDTLDRIYAAAGISTAALSAGLT
ncbi:Gfo/Idh/MocA family protein [Sphingomonas morindae]|uniref:Gfo/Idh/MocA family oxidoreductase n=1 Tax=Sphingomonas morindae TaxID=1541170 RepID=A0ABY4XA52_9SPHN|nr:Gfo/Idh/MocA family oxidoreductase [Sphingomonas morindae]USI73843.1 Gfo/Idh/MocA family oxidoreductase [Sphingomonas morindae]